MSSSFANLESRDDPIAVQDGSRCNARGPAEADAESKILLIVTIVSSELTYGVARVAASI